MDAQSLARQLSALLAAPEAEIVTADLLALIPKSPPGTNEMI